MPTSQERVHPKTIERPVKIIPSVRRKRSGSSINSVRAGRNSTSCSVTKAPQIAYLQIPRMQVADILALVLHLDEQVVLRAEELALERGTEIGAGVVLIAPKYH
ncbi:hypothetical protein LPJGGPFB_04862 [Ensifer adhaerens]|nr:hypothetical protein [Ensifer adhaerens]